MLDKINGSFTAKGVDNKLKELFEAKIKEAMEENTDGDELSAYEIAKKISEEDKEKFNEYLANLEEIVAEKNQTSRIDFNSILSDFFAAQLDANETMSKLQRLGIAYNYNSEHGTIEFAYGGETYVLDVNSHRMMSYQEIESLQRSQTMSEDMKKTVQNAKHGFETGVFSVDEALEKIGKFGKINNVSKKLINGQLTVEFLVDNFKESMSCVVENLKGGIESLNSDVEVEQTTGNTDYNSIFADSEEDKVKDIE